MSKYFYIGQSIIEQYTEFSDVNWERVWDAAGETIYMTVVSVIFVFFLGLILGLLLFETGNKEDILSKSVNRVVAFFVNVFRSIPFIILIVLLIPVTKELVGRITGPTAGLPALVIAAAPFYGRLIETGFREIDKGVIEAAESMGASKWEIIYKVLIPESLPSIVAGITTTTISLVGYTAMAGVIGAGGLGNLAFLEGFQRSKPTVTLVATVLILIIVFFIQITGDILVKNIDKR
ncbi:MAG TPA: methionine ABC transporter permease [Atopostipes sp.]|nr:methionine ABC transporter permease [Atopostipes sp.]